MYIKSFKYIFLNKKNTLSETGCHPVYRGRPFSFASPAFAGFAIIVECILNFLNKKINLFRKLAAIPFIGEGPLALRRQLSLGLLLSLKFITKLF
jgi:hypothetical protein